MAVDLEAKTTKELEVIIANCQRLGRTGDARCIDARNIVAGRRNGAFDTEKTVATICEHGKQGRFLSYNDIARASGLEWKSVFRQINPHLDAVCIYSHEQGWPLLPAIVVNQQNVSSGDMTAANRKGFLDAIMRCGWDVDIEPVAFVKREQKRVFDWCLGGSERSKVH